MTAKVPAITINRLTCCLWTTTNDLVICEDRLRVVTKERFRSLQGSTQFYRVVHLPAFESRYR